MTKAEYQKAYVDLRKQFAGITLSAQIELKKTLLSAAGDTGEIIKKNIPAGLTVISATKWHDIESQLKVVATAIANKTDELTKGAAVSAWALMSDIDKTYILSAAKDAGVMITGLQSAYASYQTTLINSISHSVYNGVSYSTRIWGYTNAVGKVEGVAGDYITRVKNIVYAGLEQGVDPVQIAKSLKNYINYGSSTYTQGVWQKLTPGAKDYIGRLGSAGADYRALRVVRTELYKGMQDAAVVSGEMNPACTGYYDWVLQSGRNDWPCECPSLAAGGPYPANAVPDYPHVLCSCVVRPVIRDRDSFVQSLKAYVNGEGNEISEWAGKYGVSVEAV